MYADTLENNITPQYTDTIHTLLVNAKPVCKQPIYSHCCSGGFRHTVFTLMIYQGLTSNSSTTRNASQKRKKKIGLFVI